MTKETFIAAAAAIKNSKPDNFDQLPEVAQLAVKVTQWRMALSMLETFRDSNPRFNEAKFMDACGVNELTTV